MSFSEDCKDCFGSTDLYFILQINENEKENLTDAKIKKAYYKQSMIWHPDRFSDEEDEEKKNSATKRFQVISKAYSILSDSQKREVYDATGLVDDEAMSSFDDDWLATWKVVFKPVTKKDIEDFFKKYLGSKEQEQDIIKYYNKYKGDMDKMLECVIGGDDEEQIRFIINNLIAIGEVQAYAKFVNEPESKRKKREQKRKREAKSADKLAKKLQKETGKSDTEFDLFAAINNRQEKRKNQFTDLISNLEEKYGGKNKKSAVENGNAAKRSRKAK